VAIARALIARPRLVFLDEPTSALDVSVQAAIIELLQRLRAEAGRAAYILVTHDLPLARQLADRIAILDGGRIVELGELDRVFREPASPITRDMLGIARGALSALGDAAIS
jgi:peptide/nickel transport system ATP-binding protein